MLLLEAGTQITAIQQATEHLVAKPLLLCLEDKSEACKEAAATLLTKLLQVCHTCPVADSIVFTCFTSSSLRSLPCLFHLPG